jgi:hypothetical protein
MKIISRRVTVLMLLASLSACGGAWAGQTWLCSLKSGMAVDEDGTVGPPDLGGLERPTFFRVDMEKKEVTLLAPASRRGEVTKIDVAREGKDLWVFSGVEHARAWSLIITAEGEVTLSMVSDGVAWAVFGHALRENEDTAGQRKAASAGK